MVNTDFPSLDEVHHMLNEIAENIPKAIYIKLNKGIILLPEEKLHPQSRPQRPLYILGEYKVNVTGRQIALYYGSFKKTHSGNSEKLYESLRQTLYHEFIHHLENLAGDTNLEIEDKMNLERYRQSFDRR